ncbi:hypothetical protein VULLAG_LOCUS6375 [Vulpes lagopus]
MSAESCGRSCPFGGACTSRAAPPSAALASGTLSSGALPPLWAPSVTRIPGLFPPSPRRPPTSGCGPHWPAWPGPPNP